MSNAVTVPMDQMTTMAASIARSGLFGAKNVDQAMAIMLLAQAEGLHPATAARDYHIIEGKPALKADAMLARHLQSGGKVKWNEYSDAKVSATFSHPDGGTVTVDWDNDRVKQAGLSERPNHKKFPRQMKRARVISEGVRTVNPGIAVGLYTPEEVEDFGAAPPARVERDMGAAEVIHESTAPAAPASTESVPASAGTPPGAVDLVSAAQASELADLCEAAGRDAKKVLATSGYADWTEFTLIDYMEAKNAFRKRIDAKAGL